MVIQTGNEGGLKRASAGSLYCEDVSLQGIKRDRGGGAEVRLVFILKMKGIDIMGRR